MQNVRGVMEAVSYKSRGIRVDGKWYNVSDALDLSDMQKGRVYEYILDKDGKTVIGIVAAPTNKTAARRDNSAKYKMANFDLTTARRRIEAIEERLARVEEKVSAGNGYKTAFEKLLDELGEIKTHQRNRDEWVMVVIRQLMAEIDELKRRLNGGGGDA